MALGCDVCNIFICHEDKGLDLAIRHQHHKGTGPNRTVAIIIQIDSVHTLARDDGPNGVVVIHFIVEVDLTVEVLTIFGEDDAAAVFLGNDAALARNASRREGKADQSNP